MVQGVAHACGSGLSPGQAPWRVNAPLSLQPRTLGLLLAGALAAAAVCWPFDFVFAKGQPLWWLQLLAQLVLVRGLMRASTARQAFAAAMVFATTWLCATFWWLYISLHTYGGLPAPLTLLSILGLAAALALYYGLAGAAFWRWRSPRPMMAAALFAAAWTMAEMARGTWLTGFGWGAMAYAHTNGPLAAWIPLLGAYGVGALAAWEAAAFAQWQMRGKHRWLLALVLLLGGLPVWPTYTSATGTLSVTLLQGAIPQDEKFDTGSGVPLALQWYGQALQNSQADLVLAPETAIPLLPPELPAGYWDDLRRHVASGHSAVLTGIPMGDYTHGYTNSVIALTPGTDNVWQYDKHHLVPFGEFIPPLFKWFTRMMHIPLGDFNRGAVGQPSFAWRGQRIGANICYEDLFGEELGARFAVPALAPTIFANVSNLGWFGDSIAIDQHLQIARMRSLEFERPTLRATNTGATVILDHRGQVQAALPSLRPGVLQGTVQGRSGLTPFALWVAPFGLWPLWLLSLAILGLAWRRAPRR